MNSMSQEISIDSLASGAAKERFEQELDKVLANIADPNTKATDVRKVSLSLSIKPSENRDTAEITITADSSLAKAKAVMTTFIMDRDNSGKAVAAELKSGQRGQTFMDDDGDVSDDTGNKLRVLYK